MLFLLLPTLAEAKNLDFEVLTPSTAVPQKGVVNALTTADIAAAPTFVHAYVASLPKWKEWTVWNEAADPTCVWQYAGEEGTLGHEMSWSGKKMGDGRLKLTAVNPDNGGISYDLWFGKAKDASRGRLTVTPSGAGSKVAWQGVLPWGFPASLFFPAKKMNSLLENDFSQGLSKLKLLAEADAEKAAAEARQIAEAAAAKAAEEAAAAKAAEEAAAAAKAAEEAAKAAEEAAKKKKGKKK